MVYFLSIVLKMPWILESGSLPHRMYECINLRQERMMLTLFNGRHTPRAD
jgi:hypothetical protein